MDQDIEYYRKFRWAVVLIGLFVMMVISIYQYSWSLFAYKIVQEWKWDLATVGMAFTIFNVATFIQPFCGYIADSFGPQKVSLLGAFLVGIGFILASWASTPGELYLYYGLGGVGVGILYGIATASAIKWFPDRRGLATGLVVFGFGAGTALFNWVIQGMLESSGLRPTFKIMGFFMLLSLIPCAFFLKYPPGKWSEAVKPSSRAGVRLPEEYPPAAMLGTRQWYLIYFCFIFTISIVLLFAAQMKMLAKEFDLPETYFSLLLVIFPIGNGLSRLLAGGISDKVGREKTMVIFYSILGLSILALVQFGTNPILFLIIAFMAGLLGGSPFGLYPATIGDYYGAKYSTTNYGITYTAKVWAGLISGWVGGYLAARTASYKTLLLIIAVSCLLAAFFSNPRIMRSPQKKI